ncbi:MAG: hypothetical protein LBT86_10305 [Deltaproteobacteria bacterium]|nr:hypothetical protein [Deltaproteobacteria bacterium]
MVFLGAAQTKVLWAQNDLAPTENFKRPIRPPLLTRLGELKAELEGELAGAKEQIIVSALALKYASQAWALAAESLVPEDASWVAEDRLDWLTEKWAEQSASWPNRQTACLRLFFESLTALTLLYAQARKDQWAYGEVAALIKLSSWRQPSHGLKFAREAESLVIWSNRLAAITPILAHLKAPDSSEALNKISRQLTNKASAIANRRDVHYQGRMELLLLNNAQGLTKTYFLLANSSGSPLVKEAQALEKAWLEETKSTSPLADQIALTWLTTAQLSFPLSFWLAGLPKRPIP